MTTRRSAWIAALSLLTVVGAAERAAAQSSMTPRAYYDGGITNFYHLECITGNVEALTGHFVGFYGTPDTTWPRVGDLYYVRFYVGVIGNECAGGIAPLIELGLPPGTSFAISGANPVYCYYTNPQGQTSQVTSGCPQSVSVGQYGYRLNWPYPLPYNTYLEIRVPVISSQALYGLAYNHNLYGYLSPTLGNWVGAQQGVFVAPNDLIFRGGFETGNLTGWSAVSPTMPAVMNWAAMRSSGYGMTTTVNGTNGIFVEDVSPANAGRYRMRFYLSPYNFDPGEAQNHRRTRVFLAFDEVPATRRVMAVVLRRISGAYALSVRVRRDDNTQYDTPFIPISAAAHSIEVDWWRASAPGANNGQLRLWIDDVLRSTLTGIDNDTAGIDTVRMGALSVKTGAGGTLLFDEMESRTTTAVGP